MWVKIVFRVNAMGLELLPVGAVNLLSHVRVTMTVCRRFARCLPISVLKVGTGRNVVPQTTAYLTAVTSPSRTRVNRGALISLVV